MIQRCWWDGGTVGAPTGEEIMEDPAERSGTTNMAPPSLTVEGEGRVVAGGGETVRYGVSGERRFCCVVPGVRGMLSSQHMERGDSAIRLL